ncbi:MAG: hypothetical protein JWN15_3450 [Firmicutes bacterium]|nr:hypothetical protein [Bacillota bacterium]
MAGDAKDRRSGIPGVGTDAAVLLWWSGSGLIGVVGPEEDDAVSPATGGHGNHRCVAR